MVNCKIEAVRNKRHFSAIFIPNRKWIIIFALAFIALPMAWAQMPQPQVPKSAQPNQT